MIIITGMDNSGKTTLAKKISEVTGLPVVHSAGPNMTQDEKRLWTLDYLAKEMSNPSRIIHDRFMPLEELVYGPILRGKSDFSVSGPIMEDLKAVKPVIVYTRPSRDFILKDNGREQMDRVKDQGPQLLTMWDELFFYLMTHGWDIVVYNFEMGEFNIEALMGMVEANDALCE